jgi:DNA-binding Lrp family transcriptional regulator
MTKATDELKATILKEKGSMTTTGLAEKYKLSQSSVRRIIREDREKEDKRRVKMVLEAPKVEMTDTIPEVIFKKTAEPIKLEGFSLADKSQPVTDGNLNTIEVEKINSDEQGDTDDFIKTFVDDAEREAEMEQEEEDDDGTEQPPAMFGSTSNNARLNKLAEAEMERQALEAGDAIDRLLGEDATETIKPKRATAVEEAKRIEDEAEQRSKYLSRIYLNVINFSDHLPFIKNQEKFLTSLHRKSTKELIALCQMIETQRSLGNVANQMKHSYFMLCRGTEILSQKYAKMKTQGFTDEMLKKERELNMIFQEIAIESADTLRAYTTPTMRLAMLTASTLMAVDNNNRMREFKEQVEAKPVNNTISQEYNDI